MVKITDGINIFTVTDGAFEIYEKQGFVKVDEDLIDNSADDYADDSNSDDESEDENIDIPLSEWSNKKVKAFAKENDIDLTGTKSVEEAKERINEFLNSAE